MTDYSKFSFQRVEAACDAITAAIIDANVSYPEALEALVANYGMIVSMIDDPDARAEAVKNLQASAADMLEGVNRAAARRIESERKGAPVQ